MHAEISDGGCAGASIAEDPAPGAYRVPGKVEEMTLKAMAESVVMKILSVFEYLVNAPMLLNSPQAATLLVSPVMGVPVQPPQTVENFLKSLQVGFLSYSKRFGGKQCSYSSLFM